MKAAFQQARGKKVLFEPSGPTTSCCQLTDFFETNFFWTLTGLG